jgi:subtilisin family serine protease
LSASAKPTIRVATGALGPAWTLAQLEGSTNRVEIGSRVVLKLDPGHSLDPFLAGSGLSLARTVSSNLFILQAADSPSAIEAAEALAKQPGVAASYPVMRRPWGRHDLYAKAPSDTLFDQQWHLENRTSGYRLAGPDLNVRGAWPITRGEGVMVAVADDGFQLDHPELVNRARGAPHYNFYRNIPNGGPASSSAAHATAVAGLIAAESDNLRGVAGVAPRSKLASWVIFGTSFFGGDAIASDEELMDMFQYALDRVAVQNHSWGSTSKVQLGLDALSDAGVSRVITRGRNGKGTVLVRAGGNEREDLTNANDDGFANDPRVIAVAAMRKDGRACTYSSPGACLLVAAPSGDVADTDGDGVPDDEDPNAPDVLTTDRTGAAGQNASTVTGDYAGFNGTSASSPQVAGVAALILGANPNLTYRDVQQILIHSSRHFDFADPDVRLNGAGFRVSHNVGFGVPDAGFAVRLARDWPNRPLAKTVSVTSTERRDIPDDALRLVCAAPDLPNVLTSIRCLPSLGVHPDDPTATLPIVFVGLANEELFQDLHGKAALIQRGGSYFADKIARAARAGAAFAVIFNNIGATEIQPMGGTTFVPIPAVSIGRNDGLALRDFIASQPDTTARLQVTPAVYRFNVSDTLVAEHVGVRLKTTHPRRSDLRVTLVSPMGSRSVLQAINGDNSAGPSDWTYWSVQHFYESTAGEWRLEVSDERNTSIRISSSSTAPAAGAATYAQLIVRGVPIADRDGDGLDDAWETKAFGHLNYGPKDDADQDGYINAREQVMGTNPAQANEEFKLEFGELNASYWRLSWPGREGDEYTLETGISLGQPFSDLSTVNGRFPVTEFVLPRPSDETRFFRIRGLHRP